MTLPPIIFDRKMLHQHRRRSDAGKAAFLREALEGEIAARAALIVRQFTHTLLLSPWPLALPDQFGEVVMAHQAAAIDEDALPFAGESFDCIISLLTLQSVNDLPGALLQMRQILKPDGLLLACLFAGETLKELRQAWLEAESIQRGGVAPRVAPMIDLRDLTSLLQRAGFALPVTDLDRTVVRYPSALALMREIKALGLSNALAERSRKPVAASLLAAAASGYEARFSDSDGRVRATVDLAWATAWAPHESQPKPLRPGSAKARLADALGVTEIKSER